MGIYGKNPSLSRYRYYNIFSLLSASGASFAIILSPNIEKIISKSVEMEVQIVSKRHGISVNKVEQLLNNVKLNELKLSKSKITNQYSKYVLDEHDSHVIAGAIEVNAKFLITYNLKHYNIDKIKADFGIVVLKPGNFLQYLRSKDKF